MMNIYMKLLLLLLLLGVVVVLMTTCVYVRMYILVFGSITLRVFSLYCPFHTLAISSLSIYFLFSFFFSIPRQGKVLAERIRQHIPYSSLSQLQTKVSGLGPQKVKTLRDLIDFEDGEERSTINARHISTSASHIDTGEKKVGDHIVHKALTKDDNSHLSLDMIQSAAAAAALKVERVKAGELKLASWNLRNLSHRRSETSLRKIGALCLQFDFLALQEVRS